MITPYLTQQKLYEILKFEFDEVISEFSFVKSRYRYDFKCNDKLIEFNGDLHYIKSATIRRDREKSRLANTAGFTFIEIPYFIQLTEETFMILFGHKPKNYEKWKYSFPHGFIDKKATLPADFSSLGILRFKNDMKFFKGNVEKDVFHSLLENPLDEIWKIGISNEILEWYSAFKTAD